MKFIDVVTTALGNTMRAKARTFLTVIAIFIGAFTLTLTSGLSVGINTYIDRMVEGFGQQDQIIVQKVSQQNSMGSSNAGPQKYDADEASDTQRSDYGEQILGNGDIDTIKNIDGVESVEPILAVSPTYMEGANGDQFMVSLGFPVGTDGLRYEAGQAPAKDQAEITVPSTWVDALGFDNAEDAVGSTVKIGMKNALGDEKDFDVTISGVTEIIVSGAGRDPIPSPSLNSDLYDYQNEGLPEQVTQSQGYFAAVAEVPDVGQQGAVKAKLTENSMMGMTVEDQIGVVRGIINTVTWVLNGFALIALLAAGFGIVNTLLMSVQERTREIGLMKSLGMSPGKIFGLFSWEAVLIGLLGSLIGVGVGVVVGTVTNSWLIGEGGPLSAIAGLTLYGIAPLQLAGIVVLVMFIAFIAGTFPAYRAARKDPIESLRYE